jgi:hypothetical protein
MAVAREWLRPNGLDDELDIQHPPVGASLLAMVVNDNA